MPKTVKLEPAEAPAITPDSDKLPHPGALIRDELKAAGYSIPSAAIAIGMNRANLNNVVLGKAALSHDMAYRLNALINRPDEEFQFARLILGMQAEHMWGKTANLRTLAHVVVDAGRKYGDMHEAGTDGHLTLTAAGLKQKLEDEAEAASKPKRVRLKRSVEG